MPVFTRTTGTRHPELPHIFRNQSSQGQVPKESSHNQGAAYLGTAYRTAAEAEAEPAAAGQDNQAVDTVGTSGLWGENLFSWGLAPELYYKHKMENIPTVQSAEINSQHVNFFLKIWRQQSLSMCVT